MSPRCRPDCAVQALDLAGDEGGLFLLVVGLVDDDGVARALLRPEVLLLALLVGGDDPRGAIEDRLGGAVVLLQAHDGRLRVVALEVEDVADVGGAPGVDRLVGVADDADVGVGRRRQQAGEHVLGDVGVLELVDQDVLVALAVALAHLRVVAQQLDRLHEDVVEVEGAVLGQQRLVALVAARDDLLEVGARASARRPPAPISSLLALRDHGEDGARRVLARRPAQYSVQMRFISAIWSASS